jgi:CubicO group peptidase (beta-lactamase class C family)
MLRLYMSNQVRLAMPLAIVSAISFGQSDPKLETLIGRYSSREPGVSVAVVRDGQVIARISRGAADVEGRVDATPATNYRLASLTKQFTATAILLLVKDQKLRLDQTIDAFFPGMPAYAKTITIRHLLTHTSGLWDYEDLIPRSQTTQFKDAEAVKFSSTHATLYFPPGSKFQYSNTGYAALAEIVAKASGMRFADFLATRVFKPAGMSSTVAYEDGISTIRNRAYGYSFKGGVLKRTDQDLTSAVLGDGGIYSSLDDLIQWNAALDKALLLPRPRLDEATSPSRLTSGAPLQYGYGWFVDPYGEIKRQWHAGETVGFHTAEQRFPDQRLTIIVLANRTDVDARKVSLQIADLYLKR